MILMHPLMAPAMLVLAIREAQSKQLMVFPFATMYPVIVIANPMWLAKTVTNVKTASGILQVEKDVRAVAATQLVLTTAHVTLILANVSANLESLVYVVTSAKLTNMDSQARDVKRAIVTSVDRKVPSVTKTANVLAMITLKAELVIGAKRTNIIVIKDAWIVQLATTSFKMQLMTTAANYQRLMKS